MLGGAGAPPAVSPAAAAAAAAAARLRVKLETCKESANNEGTSSSDEQAATRDVSLTTAAECEDCAMED